jgi:cell shape-determining protein MreC
MNTGKWIFVILILGFVGLIVFEPQIGFRVRNFLSEEDGSNGTHQLILENQILKAELASLKNNQIDFPKDSGEYLKAMVFVRYPFGQKNEILVDAGFKKGVKKDKPVFVLVGDSIGAETSVLLGRVVEVFDDYSLVQTIFDRGWQSTVKIGKSGSSAFLKGSFSPKLSLIEKDAPVKPKDVVYSVDPTLPYGVVIGEIQKTSFSSDQVFQEAELGFGYDITKVDLVFISK